MQISCFPAEIPRLGSHLREFASPDSQKRSGRSEIGFAGPPEPPKRQKPAQNVPPALFPGPFFAFFAIFVVSPVFSPSDLGPPTSDLGPPLQPRCEPFSAPKTPFAVVFSRKMPLVRPILRDRHYLAPHKRHKADFARILALSARSLFPEPAARCAVDPAPHFLYSLATQEISPRHVKPTSGRLNTTVVH